MKMRLLAPLLLACLALPPLLWQPSLWAKPKVDVRVTVKDGVGKTLPEDVPSRTGAYMDGPFRGFQVFYFNVTLRSISAEAVGKNNGQWCIKGDSLLGSITYRGMLSGNDLQIEIPQKNGKVKKMNFVVYDHKWRKLADM